MYSGAFFYTQRKGAVELNLLKIAPPKKSY